MKWLYGLLCLIFLIVFHEFGHFLAAKLFGVKVESFSVGFGPILLHRTINGTDYRLSLIPLGGYCGMKGEKDFQRAIEEKLPEIKAEPDSLYGIHPFKRALIGFAGPFFNFIFAVFACSLINGIGYTYTDYSNQILINEKVHSSVARDAGLQSGDRILKVNGKETATFFEVGREVKIHPDEDITLLVDRDGQELTFTLHTDLDKNSGAGLIGIAADESEPLELESPHYGFFASIGQGFIDAVKSAGLTIKSIGILFKGVNLDTAVSGPIRATEMMGSTVKNGFAAGFKIGLLGILDLLSVISISLFIMNLLPVPILDGGLILIAFIEIIFRRKINPRIQYYIQFIGLAFIFIILFIGLKGDILYIFNSIKKG